MEVPIIQIGNSRGIRISKNILDKYNIKNKVKLDLDDSGIKITPIDEPRQGWAEKFAEMHRNGDDKLLIDDVFEDETFDDL
jgi:antitoxin MazE